MFIAAQKSFKGKNGRKEKRRKEGRKEEGRGKDAAVVVPSSSSSSLHLTFIELLVWAWGGGSRLEQLGVCGS